MGTYNGRLELLVNRPSEVRNGWRPSVKSPTELGEQLVCTALYWLSQDVVEVNKQNHGKFIDLFKEDYYGKEAASKKQEPYCAIFAWFLVNEATKNMGCSHKFPGNAETYGNARNTLLKSKNVYRTEIDRLDTPPTVGSMMYRYSTESSSSGHFGLVVDVDTKNRTFDTIEGNVRVTEDGSKEGVGYWRYRFDDVKTGNGIAFIHVEEESSCKNAKAKSYKGFECRPVSQQTQTPVIAEVLPKCIKKVGNNYIYYNQSNQAIGTASKFNNKWYTNVAGKGWVEVTNCDYEYESPVVNNTPTPPKESKQAYSPIQDTQKTPKQKKEICRDVIVTVPPKSKLQHFEVLQDNVVLSDITGANLDRVSEAKRNGSALWYNRSDINPGSHTGFGMFRDRVGNLIYFLDANQPQSKDILNKGFLGYKVTRTESKDYDFPEGANVINIGLYGSSYNSDGWKELFTNHLAESKMMFGNYSNIDDHKGYVKAFIHPKSNLNKVVDWSRVPGRNVINYLREIERKGKQPSPIIIYINQRSEPPSTTRILNTALTVVSSVSNLVGIPIPAPIMKTADALVAVAERRNITNITDLASQFAGLAEFFAPEFVKEANKYIGTARQEIGSYIKKAENIFSNYINTATIDPLGLRNIESKLGLDKGEVNNLLNRYSSMFTSVGSLDLTKILKGANLNEVSKVVENTTNMLMLGAVRRGLKSGGLQIDIGRESNPIRNIPVLQDLFIAGGSNAALRLFPKIDEFTATLLENNSVITTIKNSLNGPEMIAGIIGNNYGHIPTDKSIMKEFQLEALIGKALQTDKNTPFALPQSIEPEYKECYKFIIEQTAERKVLWCPDGWEWDHDLRKCVNKTVSSGYTPINSTSSNAGVTGNKVITSNTPVKTGTTPVKQDIGFIPNDWEYYGEYGNTGLPPVKKIVLPPTELPKELPPKKEILPPCISAENGEYYYYPNRSNKPTEVIYEQSPATTMYSLPGGVNTQLVRTELKPTDYVSLPGGIVTLPPNNGFNQDPFVVGGVPTGGQYALPMPLPLGLSDEVLPDKIRVYRTNTGTPDEAWYVRINGVIYDFDPNGCKILGWNPTKKVEIKVPDKVTPPSESSEAEKLIKKMQDQQKEYEAQLAIERAKNKVVNPQPDERIIALEKQIEQQKLQNKQNEALLINEIKKISAAKSETSPELIAQLERMQQQMAEQAKIINETNKPTENPNQAVLKEIELLKQELEVEKNRKTAIQTAAPQVQKAVEECTDCEIAKLPSRVVSITEYGNHTKRNCNDCYDCMDCDCGECN